MISKYSDHIRNIKKNISNTNQEVGLKVVKDKLLQNLEEIQARKNQEFKLFSKSYKSRSFCKEVAEESCTSTKTIRRVQHLTPGLEPLKRKSHSLLQNSKITVYEKYNPVHQEKFEKLQKVDKRDKSQESRQSQNSKPSPKFGQVNQKLKLGQRFSVSSNSGSSQTSIIRPKIEQEKILKKNFEGQANIQILHKGEVLQNAKFSQIELPAQKSVPKIFKSLSNLKAVADPKSSGTCFSFKSHNINFFLGSLENQK